MRRSILLGVIAGSALMVASGFAFVRGRPEHAGAGAVATAPAKSATAPVAAPMNAPRAQPGDVNAYALAIVADIQVADAAGAMQGAAHVRTAGRAIEITLQRSDTASVSVIVVDVSEGAAATWLARGIVVERDGSGAIGRARLPVGVDGEGASALASIAEVLSSSAPRDGAQSWDAREGTAHGARLAHYELRGGDGEFVKRVQPARGPETATSVDETGELRGAFDARGTLTALAGRLTQTHRLANGGVVARASQELSLSRTSASRDLARAIAISGSMDDAFGPWQALDAPLPRSKADDDRALSRIVGARTLADMNALIARADADDAAARSEIGDKLWAFLRLHPEAAAAIGGRVRAMRPDEGAAKLVANALIASATPESQRALVELAKAWRGDDAATTILAGLGLAPAPTRNTEEFLRATMADPNASTDAAHASAIALGNVADKVRGDDPARADAIAADLVDRAKAATDPADISSTLAALGNARSDRAVEVATKLLESADPVVRRMAAFALGRSGSATSRDALERAATTDPDDTVRHEAKTALGG